MVWQKVSDVSGEPGASVFRTYDGAELYLCSIYMLLWRTQGFYYSVVGVRTGYRLEGSGFNSQLGQVIVFFFSAPVETGPAAHPASSKMGAGRLYLRQISWGVALTTHPLL